MKTAREWVSDHTQSGAFDCVENCASVEVLVRAIQADAMRHAAQLVHDMSRGTKSDDRAAAIDEARDLIADEAERVTAQPNAEVSDRAALKAALEKIRDHAINKN